MTQVNIYFGSQSGTAECFSDIISDEAAERGIKCEVIDLEQFTPESFQACKIAILVVATYGDGEPSDNAFKFHKWATDPRNKGALTGQRFTVMGLGDMNYSKFNNMGQTTDIGLDLIGSKRIHKRGVGDDSQDIEADFRKWKDGGLWEALQQAIKEVSAENPGWPVAKKEEPKAATGFAPPARKTRILCAGGEAKEAGEALADAWPGGNAVVEDASLAAIGAATGAKEQVVLAIECNGDGLCDEGAGIARQLGNAPMAIKTQLRSLRFSMLAVASTEYGNAGERANANAVTSQISGAVEPVMQALQKVGAGCVGKGCLDLQNADEKLLGGLCAEFQKGFQQGLQEPAKDLPFGTPKLKMADSIGALPAECKGEPAEVLCKFYFEADKTKITKVRELRQKPNAQEGLATAEVELEASGELKNYALGGTLSVLPESDPADIEACMALLGVKPADLKMAITFSPKEGPSHAKIKRPFPTPCTLGQALSRYCDLARTPSKKMLQAMQPKLEGQAAEHVAKILADADALKLLHASPLCCKMHEFWSLLGVTSLPGALEAFLLNCPRQKAREFTIASSPKAAPTKITLCVSLTSHGLPEGGKTLQQLRDMGCLPKDTKLPAEDSRRFFGQASSWLATRLKAGDEVLAKQRPSPFHLPDKDVPVVMVGSGAGVAPFRGFWEELKRGSRQAPAALFFGCRHPEEDWLFREEMSGAVSVKNNACGALAKMQVGPKRPLTMLHTAFSRPGDGKESKYVQKAISEQKMSIKHWVEKMNGCVFICGSTAMGNGVLEALAEMLEGGKDAVEQLRKDGRIVAEMWG